MIYYVRTRVDNGDWNILYSSFRGSIAACTSWVEQHNALQRGSTFSVGDEGHIITSKHKPSKQFQICAALPSGVVEPTKILLEGVH